MTIYELAQVILNDKEFLQGGIPNNEQKLFASVGLTDDNDISKLYTALIEIKRLNDKYSK